MKSTVLRILISAFFFIIFFFLVKGHWSEIVGEIKASDSKMLVPILAVGLAGYWLTAARLTIVFRAQKVQLSWIKALESIFIGSFFSNFLPTGIGGDLAKAHCLSVITKDALRSWTCVFVDRFLGFLVFITITAILMFFFYDRLGPVIVWTFFAVVIGMAFLCMVLFSRHGIRQFEFLKLWILRFRLGKKFLTAYRDSHALMQNRQLIVQVSCMSVLCQIDRILMVYFIIRALGARLDLVYLCLCLQLTGLFSMLPSINGLGLRETGFVFFMKGNLGYSTACAVAILSLFYQFVFSLIGGLLIAFKREYHF